MNKSKFQLKFSDISTYRGELFGWAIISVILLHYFSAVTARYSGGAGVYLAKAYNALIGSVGVDIFVFLSGFGIYYSLCGNKNLVQFYKKRVVRVILPYLALGLVFWIIKDFILQKEPFLKYLCDLCLLTFWTDGTATFWYIAFITVMYLLSYWIYKIADTGMRTVISIAAWIGISIAIYCAFPVFFDNTEIALLRVPQYILGMAAGRLSKQNISMKKAGVIALFAALPVKLLLNVFSSPFERAGNILYSVLLIAIYILIRKYVFKGRLKAVPYIGRYTLELYITHISVRNIMGSIGMNLADPVIYISHIAIFIVLTVLLVLFENSVISKLVK